MIETDTAAPAKTGSGKFSITILKSGQGSSGYYPADVMERDGAKTFPKGTHVYLDHPTEDDKYNRPARSVRDLAGTLTEDAQYDKGSQSLIGTMQIVPQYAALVESLAPYVGMSIRALAYAENAEVGGVMVSMVKEFVKGESVDIVTRAGAGGKIISMIESARNSVVPTPPAPVGTPKERNTMELTKEDLVAALAESNKLMLAGLTEALKPAPVAGDPLDAVLGLANALSTSGLNEAAQKLVIESVRHGAKPLEAIEAHKEAFGAAPQGQPQGQPGGMQTVVQDAYGQLVMESDRRHGFAPANVPAPVVGGTVVGQGTDGMQLSESEKTDWEATVTRLASKGRAF